MMKQAQDDPDSSLATIAWYYICLGNLDLAFEFLEKTYQARDVQLFDIKVEPFYDKVRSDPRFAVLLQKLRLS